MKKSPDKMETLTFHLVGGGASLKTIPACDLIFDPYPNRHNVSISQL